jgi:hypothetical protein
MLIDDLEGSYPDSRRDGGIEGEDPTLCVDAKYRGSGGTNTVSECPEVQSCPGSGTGSAGRSVE